MFCPICGSSNINSNSDDFSSSFLCVECHHYWNITKYIAKKTAIVGGTLLGFDMSFLQD